MPGAVPNASHDILNSSIYKGRVSDAKDRPIKLAPRHCKSAIAYFKQVSP